MKSKSKYTNVFVKILCLVQQVDQRDSAIPKKMSLSLEAGVIYNVQRGVKNKTALSLPPDDAHTTACNPIHCEMESTVINLDIA